MSRLVLLLRLVTILTAGRRLVGAGVAGNARRPVIILGTQGLPKGLVDVHSKLFPDVELEEIDLSLRLEDFELLLSYETSLSSLLSGQVSFGIYGKVFLVERSEFIAVLAMAVLR